MHIPPVKGEYTDYSVQVHPVPHASKKNTISSAFDVLKSINPELYNDIDVNNTLLIQAINEFIYLNQSLYDKNPNQMLNNLRSTSTESTESIGTDRHNKTTDYYPFIAKRLEDVFDIVLVVECAASNSSVLEIDKYDWNQFFDVWKDIMLPMHFVVIQIGDLSCDFRLPSWMDYDLFNKNNIFTKLGDDITWIFDMSSGSIATGKVIGTMLADREYVYFLDQNMYPVYDDITGDIINPLQDHFINLVTPSSPYYYNTLYDAYRPGSDFSRGYPYSLKEGIPTAMSLGHVIVSNHLSTSNPKFDVFSDLNNMQKQGKNIRKSYVIGNNAVTVIPYGILFSLSTINLAINREMVGPTFYLPNIFRQYEDIHIGDKNIEILTGWMAKLALDHARLGVKHGGMSVVYYNASVTTIGNSTARSSKERVLNHLEREIKQDLLWSQYSEILLRYFVNDVIINDKTHDSTSIAMKEVVNHLNNPKLTQFNEIFIQLEKAYSTYLSLWNRLHAFYPDVSIISSKSSLGPNIANSKHSCAVFTIFYKEPYLLPVWLRYYNKYFPDSMFILQHHRHDSDPDPEIPHDIHPTLWKLYGEVHGFSVMYMAHMAQIYQLRLLRKGYKCVIFTGYDY